MRCKCKNCKNRVMKNTLFVLLTVATTCLTALAGLRYAQSKMEIKPPRQREMDETSESYQKYLNAHLAKQTVYAILREKSLEKELILIVAGVSLLGVSISTILSVCLG